MKKWERESLTPEEIDPVLYITRMKDVLTDSDISYLRRQWTLILDPFGRIHFKDKNGVFEYMGGRL